MRIDANSTLPPAATAADAQSKTDSTNEANLAKAPTTAAAATAVATASVADSAAVVTLTSQSHAKEIADPSVRSRIDRVKELLARNAYPIDFSKLAGLIVDDTAARAGTGKS